MSKKYLSQDEAAAMLGMPREELTRLRERGEIRGFADRGTWKFKLEDIQNLGRTRQADSDPDVHLVLDDESAISDADIRTGSSGSGSSSSGAGGSGSSIVISGELSHSDSDVRLIPEDPVVGKTPGMSDSDSDVKLVGDGSDSDVKLVDDADSDSDVKLVGDETIRELNMAPSMSDSDSDVKLVQPVTQPPADLNETLSDRSDSDVQLLDDKTRAGDASDSDVAILSSDSAISLDFGHDAESDSVFGDESTLGMSGSGLLGAGSGISLEGPSDSGIALGSPEEDESLTISPDKPDSGISLASDSGISLAGDSGISLSSADSGISLEAVADSGISLEDSNEFVGTVPMMNTIRDLDDGPETKFEMPSMSSDDSAFELQTRKGPKTDETGVLDLSDSGEGSLDDAVFDIDDVDASDSGEIADLDVEDDILGEDEEIEELDVFDADDDAFAGADEDEDMAGSMISRAAVPVEEEWGVGALIGLSLSCAVTLVSGYMMMELVRSMWLWGDRGETGGLLGFVKGLL